MNDAALVQLGFQREFSILLNQEAWVLHKRVEDLPYLHEHVEDGDEVLGTMDAEVVLTVARLPVCGYEIHVLVSDADYHEGPYLLDSAEGQQVFQDAQAAATARA